MKRGFATVVVVAVTATGCSLGERTQHARLLVGSPTRAAAAGTAVGTMSLALSVEPAGDVGEGSPLAGAASLGNLTPPPTGELPIVIDFTRQAASISLSVPGGAPEPMVVLDGTRVFVRRGSTTGISSRRWVVLDLATLDELSPPEPEDVSERTGLPIVAFPGPLQLIELLAGSLTGSARQAGPGAYAANLSREKADRELDLDEKAIEQRSRALNLVAVLDEVHPAEVTIDGEGRPEALRVHLRPRVRKDLKAEVVVGVRLAYQPATVTIPPADDVLVLETEGQLIAELASLGRALSGGGEGEDPPAAGGTA